jgi:hypothetical protein
MSDGRFKLARVQLGQIYLMGLRYIRSGRGDTVLKPDEDRINPVGRRYPIWGRICLTGAVAMVLELDGDRINLVSRIYLTRQSYHASET